jgi:HSP20 family molecular chaperone IbpA
MNIMTHHPLANGIFSELNRFVNQSLVSEAENRCMSGECELPEYSDIESITNDPDGWKLRLELPGYRKDEVKLSVDEDFLHVVAETEDEERSFLGKEGRRVKISDDVDAENIKARLENGILFLEIPRKVKEAPKPIVIK